MSRLSWAIAYCVGCATPHGAEEPREGALLRMLRPGCAGSPYETIQDAVDASGPGDVIEVCAGTWTEHLVISGRTLTLRSASGPSSTVLDAGGSGHALAVLNGSNVVVEGLTVRGGATASLGGNVVCTDSRLVLRDSVIEGGSATWGGGLGTTSCTGAVEGSVFRDNTATDRGGGLYSSGELRLSANLFEGNTANQGGGAFVAASAGAILGNTVTGNASDDDGGGIYVLDSTSPIDANTFEDNEAGGEGGGLRVKGSELVVTNNLLQFNRAEQRGGGSKISHDEVVMVRNTFVGNTAADTAGALLLFESASWLSGEVYVDNEADRAGAVAVLEGWGGLLIEDAHFQGNRAEDEGGHLFVDLRGFDTVLRRVKLVDGSAEIGGALAARSESEVDDEEDLTGLRLENTLLRANVATEGGALHLVGVTGTVTNSVFADNEAGLFLDEGTLGVTNSVFVGTRDGVAAHVASGVVAIDHSVFHDNEEDLEGMDDVVGSDGNVDVAPDFIDAAGGDFHLAPGSPLIDAGDPTVTDPDGTRSDVGLYGGPAAR